MLAEYSRKIKSAPRQLILSRSLLFSCVMYATAAIPLSKSILTSIPYSNPIDDGPQHGIKDRRRRYLLYYASSNSSVSVLKLVPARPGISSLLCTLAMQSGPPYHFS